MLKRFSFWRAFVMLIFAAAVGNSVISFARDLAISVGAVEALATSLVGILAVCNGLGRIITGTLFDILGRKRTMLIATLLTVVAAATSLVAVLTSSVAVCVVGLCLIGLSYGTCPIIMTSFTAAFYGQKHFASNFGVTNCNLMAASVIATVCNSLMAASGGYTMPFILLLALAVLALGLNISIRKP
jgi:OFA family oxalate/formate antiporter-like MFS transporter